MHFLVLEHFFYYRYSFSCYLKSCICFSGIVNPQEKRSGAREQILLEGQLQKVTEFISYLENWSNFELFYTCLVCSAAVISYSSTPRVPFRYQFPCCVPKFQLQRVGSNVPSLATGGLGCLLLRATGHCLIVWRTDSWTFCFHPSTYLSPDLWFQYRI